MPILKSTKVHFIDEIKPARIRFSSGESLEVLSYDGKYDLDLKQIDIAPAIADPHVHFRESYSPNINEWENYYKKGIIKKNYADLIRTIQQEKKTYGVKQGILAALKGGVWLVGAMSNTSFPAADKKIWQKTNQQYQSYALAEISHPIYIHLWHYAHPQSEPIAGQCAKDFGTTFGAENISFTDREKIYQKHSKASVRFHNDRAPHKISLTEFAKNYKKTNSALLHDDYFHHSLVLKEQKMVYEWAKKHHLDSLIPMHIPSGSALKQMLNFQKEKQLNIELEVGLDYLSTCQEDKTDNTRFINYRRPAHTPREEQITLIEELKKIAQQKNIWIGSDHAPHSKKAKEWKNGLPASPGTRCLELYAILLQRLITHSNFEPLAVDRLASYNPQNHILKYMKKHFDFPQPVGSIKTGNMANLRIFDTEAPFVMDEKKMAQELQDREYHSGFLYRKDLQGKNLMTIVNGNCFDTRKTPHKIDL